MQNERLTGPGVVCIELPILCGLYSIVAHPKAQPLQHSVPGRRRLAGADMSLLPLVMSEVGSQIMTGRHTQYHGLCCAVRRAQ